MHDVEEEIKELAHEAAEGSSPRTPLIVLSGVVAFVMAAVVIVAHASPFSPYYLS